jgi:hypothetical protein
VRPATDSFSMGLSEPRGLRRGLPVEGLRADLPPGGREIAPICPAERGRPLPTYPRPRPGRGREVRVRFRGFSVAHRISLRGYWVGVLSPKGPLKDGRFARAGGSVCGLCPPSSLLALDGE